jgi:hypothetical protein
MKSLVQKCALGVAAAFTVAVTAAPAEARRYHRDDDDAAIAVAAGIVGLGLGVALASDRGRYYDDYGYYHRRHYRPYRYGYGYRSGYRYGHPRYYRGHRRHYARDCFTRRVWDPYWGRRVKVRYCN